MSELDDRSETDHAAPGAEKPAVGRKIRAFRNARKMSIRDLAEVAEVSPGFISQLENNRTNAGLGTLRRIAAALGIAFVDLFTTDTATSRVLRRDERPLLPTRSGTKKYAITLPPLQGLEVYISEIEPGDVIGDTTFTHGDSQEIAFVLRGEVRLTVSEGPFDLAMGDSLEFRSSEPHQLENTSAETAEVMWITCPPTIRNPNTHGKEEI